MNDELLTNIVDSFTTEGWKVVETEINKLLQQNREQLEIYRKDDADDDFVKGEISAYKQVLALKDNYIKEYKKIQK